MFPILVILWLAGSYAAPHLLITWLVTIAVCIGLARRVRWCAWVRPDLAGFLIGFFLHFPGVLILFLAWVLQHDDTAAW